MSERVQLDLSSVLGISMDDIEDIGDIVIPPVGHYIFRFKDVGAEMDDKERPVITIELGMVAALEAAPTAEFPLPSENDLILLRSYPEASEKSLGFLKKTWGKAVVAVAGAGATMDKIAMLKDMNIAARVTHRVSERDVAGKKVAAINFDLKNVTVLTPEDVATLIRNAAEAAAGGV